MTIDRYRTFIDGNNLKKDIINRLPQLNKFVFNIQSIISLQNKIHLLSNEEIQRTFTNFIYNEVISCVDYFLKEKTGQCHIYSYPYTMKRYYNITNNFPGGLFKCVRQISLFDENPFEHEFFLRIAKSFPLMKKLSLSNLKRPKRKQHIKLKNVNEKFSIIEYRHLTELELTTVHKDYVELFLDHRKTCLPNNIFLSIDYRPLRKATHNFTREVMRVNCAKLSQLLIYDEVEISQQVKDYFPRVKRF
ncbi:unnamed protein product [Rotaria sp. Silwood1]|nr:unnamed protein product [Rotaria sp. Silwood1]CAF1374528.1 unnamed protein product [Rotaria sp. Silwood1]CAF1375732.1 unnamed protein product [Rotaria sp. Silwood1]CAF3558488.1 unnamed protein product [Rotaria sp. Silwood1]CAF3582108.1 unnamed protein product [Rotaria sp. Silwood1]